MAHRTPRGEYDAPLTYGSYDHRTGTDHVHPDYDDESDSDTDDGQPKYVPSYPSPHPSPNQQRPSPQGYAYYAAAPPPAAVPGVFSTAAYAVAAPPSPAAYGHPGNGWAGPGYPAAIPQAGQMPPTFGTRDAGFKTPPGGDYADAIVLSPTIRAEQASIQGPCPILWDVRRPTTSAAVTNATGVNPELNQPATYPPTRRMVIVSRHIPWPITITKYSIIRCKDVLEAVYKELQEPMTIPEYFLSSPEKRETIDKVNARETFDNPRTKRKWTKHPHDSAKKVLGPRLRVDYLDQMVSFRGLFHDPKFLEERLGHDPDALQDGWVLALAFSSERFA